MDNNQYQTVYQSRPTRAADFRRIARQRLKGFWWTAILVTLVASLLGGVALGSASVNFNFGSSTPDYSDPDYGTEDGVVEEESTLTPEEMEEMEQAIADFDFGTVGDIFSEVDPMVGFIFSFFGILFGVITLIAFAIQLFVSSPVKVGYQRFFLEVIDGNESEIKVGTLFRFFKESYGKTIGLNFLHTLIMDLTMLPMLVGLVATVFSVIASIPAMLSGNAAALGSGILMAVGIFCLGTIVSLCINLPVSYAYSMAHMIMADYPTVGAVEALRLSRQMMKGNKFRLFCLDFSFIGWALLGACVCGLGSYVVTPYQYAARAAFYHEISGRSTPEDVEFPSVNPDDYYIE